MSSVPSSISSRLKKIPGHLRIFILFSDDDVVVIRKPPLLRSVRGIATSNHPPPDGRCDEQEKINKRANQEDVKQQDESASSQSHVTSTLMSMQDAWVHAIQFYRKNDDAVNAMNTYFEKTLEDLLKKEDKDKVETLKVHVLEVMINLASKPDEALGSISRRGTAFKKYVSRNRKTLLPSYRGAKRKRDNSADRMALCQQEKEDNLIDEIADIVFKILCTKTNEIYSQATGYISTKDEESADGQLYLLTKVTDNESITKLYGILCPPVQEHPFYVIHRLDCETSGVMVVARTATAASFLSKAWRDRDRVVKQYVARVKHWPPFEDEGKTSGSIHLAMASMDNDRIKWGIKSETNGGKPCETQWKLREEETTHDFITLELTPITGRTHQLRVHCAAIGSGIIGDSLYGEYPIKFDEEASYCEKPSHILRLHAECLSFPHPSSNTINTFVCDHGWGNE